MIDPERLLSGGGFIAAAVGYAALSAFVTGPLVIERTAQKQNWAQACPVLIATSVRAQEPEPSFTPKFDCESLLGGWGKAGEEYCRKHGDKIRIPGLDQIEAHERKVQSFKQRRLEAEIASSSSRCSCALSVTIERHRLAFALYAGSARLMTPLPAKNLTDELTASLAHPLCAAKPSPRT